MIKDSLFARATTDPPRNAARVGSSPAAPARPFTTTSHSTPAISTTTVGPAMTSNSGIALRVTVLLSPGVDPQLQVRNGREDDTATTDGWNSRTCSSSSSPRPPEAAKPTTSKRSGLRRMTLSACVPMEPVLPDHDVARVNPRRRARTAVAAAEPGDKASNRRPRHHRL